MTIKLEEDPFFHQFSDEDQKFLLSQGTEITIKKGKTLFLDGDSPKHIYYVKSGRIRLSKTTAEGRILFLQLILKNEFVGELSLFNNLKRTCNADVIKDTTLIRFERVVLENICRHNSLVTLAFMKWFTTHNNSLLSQFRDLVFGGKKAALFSILIRLSNAYGRNKEDSILIEKKLTNQELANYIGATRESVSRILKNLIDQKVISIEMKYITIHNIKFLKEQLRCENCP